jgi:hypothetical protein
MHYNVAFCSGMTGFILSRSFTRPSEYINAGINDRIRGQTCEFEGTKSFIRHFHAMIHWVQKHGEAAHDKPGQYSCSVCKLGFFSRDMYAAHYMRQYGEHISCGSTHVAALKRRGVMWIPGPACIQVTSNSCHLSYLELCVNHMASTDPRKDHAVLVSRQFDLENGFHTTYLEKITRIAGSTVVSLRSRADIAALPVVASYKARSRLMPSRAADCLTEMQMLETGYFEV